MCSLGLIFTQESFGFLNEPTGLGGNKWGTPVGEMNCGLKLITSIDKIKFEAYEPDIKLKLFDAMVLFLDGKLTGYSMRLKDPSMVGMFLIVCYKAHGDPTSESNKFVTWESKNTTVELDLVYGIITVGPMSGILSLEALFDWYESQGGKISPESKPHI
jgi:hypothetical protein